ncbi:uncharacterized protein E0L32_000555 [Thyridium curvatum]|uniref:Integral membrane protein n=1 Tax=Thyridium curvatum TaxID=1093900 RepID=A0A507BAP9_9PEZI|nr:uncharacterized protein E0L32_000555 [Thyridium curvatum]TPX14161.1 hypothetical protein E0L32_000555 [Thyridium curvatum]
MSKNSVEQRESTSQKPAANTWAGRIEGWITASNFIKFAALGGPLTILFFFLWMPATNNLPPMAPSLSPERVRAHYMYHEKGYKGGLVLMTLASFFQPLYTAAVAGQMSRIPGVPKTAVYAQMLGGAMGGLFLCLPPYLFAATMYRAADRAPELTQLLNDLSWIVFAMPFPALLCQEFAFSYAILLDKRPNPLFPRWVAYTSSALTLGFWPATGVHCVHSGAVAWNGGLAFWVAGVTGGAQFCLISWAVFRAAMRTDLPGENEPHPDDLSTTIS